MTFSWGHLKATFLTRSTEQLLSQKLYQRAPYRWHGTEKTKRGI
jgi:hypothetical protein